jgi:osmoprotectant transport system substrate-binding protein
MRSRFAIGVAAALALTLSLTACSSSKKTSTTGSTGAGANASAGSLTVGSADFPESVLLADIYADALSAKGVKITKKLNIGERSVYFTALKGGSIDFFPEYSGSILAYLDAKSTAKTPADVAAALPAALGSSLTALNYASAQDSDTITVTQATATKDNLKTIADLAPVAKDLVFGAPAAFQTRPDGIPALKSVYGVTFKSFTALSASGTVTVQALKNGSIQAGDIFSTDPSLAANHFVALQDPKSMFAAQNIVPIVATAKVNQTIKDATNAVSAKLDTTTLATLVAQVANGQQPDAVAKAWLSSMGLG